MRSCAIELIKWSKKMDTSHLDTLAICVTSHFNPLKSDHGAPLINYITLVIWVCCCRMWFHLLLYGKLIDFISYYMENEFVSKKDNLILVIWMVRCIHHNIILLLQFLFPSSTQSSSTQGYRFRTVPAGTAGIYRTGQ